MAPTATHIDELIDRRRLRRRLTFWRIAALLALVFAALALLSALGAFNGLGEKRSDHVARVEISGIVRLDENLIDLMDKLSETDAVKGVILDLATPGGTTVGGEAIYNAVRKLAAEKPVATSVGSMAASAGYMIASASDHIVARRSSIVGSIGVIFQYGQVSELLDKIGVEMAEIKSTPLKAEPSPFHPASPEAKQMIARLVNDNYEWFVELVAERRNLTPQKARELADGSVFSGAEGVENGLVDEIGGEDTARRWLIAEHGLNEDIEVIEWKPAREGRIIPTGSGLAGVLTRWIAALTGGDIAQRAEDVVRDALPERLFLDGLISMLQIDYRQ